MEGNSFAALKKELPQVKKNILLKDHTTFKIGGPAEYFLVAKSKKDLLKGIKTAKNLKMPVFVLGGGSNLLVLDGGIRGLVIQFKDNKIRFLKNNVIFAAAGAFLKDVVEYSVSKSLEGMEWAGGLPGTFGGAVRGNAGAFGGETKDSVVEVEALDDAFKLRKFSNRQCMFSYRSSVFKQKNWTVVGAKIKFKKGNKKKLLEVMQSRIDYRKQRHPLEYPNAGSIFKNVDVRQFTEDLAAKLASVVKKDPFPVIPAAYLISEAGLKGKRFGGAQVSEKHPNFIVNLGEAKASDVLALMDMVREKVKNIFGVSLEEEVQIIGNCS